MVSRGRNRGKHCCSSGVIECEVSGGSGALKNTDELKDHRVDIEVYPGSGYQGPMSSSLSISIFWSTQIEGLQQSVREIWQGIAQC